jgi:D-alanyl-D-alanine carboxypeptidase
MIAQSNDSASPTTLASSPEPTDPKLLGHFPYPEAPPSELVPIVADGSLKLRKAAAQAFQQMVAAAQAEEVALVPISGFRSQADQNYLFFNVKAQRGQTASKRAEVSAPPGYSEHHTGYAVDIGDRTVPALNLNPDFEKTKAFQWLQSNAARFSFELSFPQGNAPGVTYEPWHWRFVGDRQSLETFYKARSGVKPKP